MLRAEAVQTVGVALKLGQVVEQRRRHTLRLRVDSFDMCRSGKDSRDDCFRLFAGTRQPHGRVHWLNAGAEPCSFVRLGFSRRELRRDIQIVLNNERPNGQFPFHDHGKSGGLHPADRELLLAGQSVSTGEIHTHQPVRPAAAARRIYRALSLSGYARIDMRLTPDGNLYVLEANANPNLAQIEDFATSALASSLGYDKLLERILQLGLAYDAAWRHT